MYEANIRFFRSGIQSSLNAIKEYVQLLEGTPKVVRHIGLQTQILLKKKKYEPR